MFVQRIRQVFRRDDAFTSVEERSFCAIWMDERDRSIAMMGFVIGLVYHSLSLISDQFLIVQDGHRWFMAQLHFLYVAAAALYLGIRHLSSTSTRTYAMLAQIISVYGYVALFIEQAQLNQGLNLPLVKSWSAFLAMSIFLIQICPFHTKVVYFYASIFAGLSGFAWSHLDGHGSMFGVSLIAIMAAAAFQRSQVKRSFREARREFETRKQLAQAQKLAFDHQLAVARQIQDSLAPPAQYSDQGIRVRFLQKKHEHVGGDWMSYRTDDDGRVIIVVADASGKGVQAALVVHAVQALWAEALAYPKFRPEIWLGRVNDALNRMGNRSVHAMTIGIIVAQPRKLEYWSAGHLPAFIVNHDGSKIEVMAARGPMLGVQSHDQFASATRLIGAEKISVLLASDGVFGKGSTQSPREIRQFFESLTMGVDDLGQITPHVDDDRSLAWLSIDADFNDLQPIPPSTADRTTA
jgi:hypothetical protein